MKIGIIGAMPEEIDFLKADINTAKKHHIANRDFFSGELYGYDTVAVLSHCGKVSASCTATLLLNEFEVDAIIFTGVAGAAQSSLNIGDIVIGETLYQHDLTAEPISPKFHIPLTDKAFFKSNATYIELATIAAKKYLANIDKDISPEILSKFYIAQPKVVTGTIATGDQFVFDALTNENMQYAVDERAVAVEMEGAAVAHVCEEFNKPHLIIRTISDKADHSASIDFKAFIENVSNHYSRGIVKNFFKEMSRYELNKEA